MKMLYVLIPLFFYGCAPTVDYTKIREDYVVAHPQLSQQDQQDIKNGSIRPGMTKEDVQASWGISDEEFKYEGTKSCSTMGCIETLKHGRTYLTFVDGKLQSWTDVNY